MLMVSCWMSMSMQLIDSCWLPLKNVAENRCVMHPLFLWVVRCPLLMQLLLLHPSCWLASQSEVGVDIDVHHLVVRRRCCRSMSPLSWPSCIGWGWCQRCCEPQVGSSWSLTIKMLMMTSVVMRPLDRIHVGLLVVVGFSPWTVSCDRRWSCCRDELESTHMQNLCCCWCGSLVVYPSKVVVALLVHLDVVDDTVESISSDRTCCSISFDRTCCWRCRFHILMSNLL